MRDYINLLPVNPANHNAPLAKSEAIHIGVDPLAVTLHTSLWGGTLLRWGPHIAIAFCLLISCLYEPFLLFFIEGSKLPNEPSVPHEIRRYGGLARCC